ncbi:RNA methyltransferase [Salinarimonas sp.]|uniref:RNA methyltransferase n=1 Tax=Salinarimonas sp. TaxID=2766526 RepID=UPI00391D69A3
MSGAIPRGPAIVLVEPQLGENIGMCARAMGNFALDDLRLVAPRDGWPNPAAEATAAGAVHVLERARVFERVEDAIADCRLVYATTARERGQMKRVLSPEEAAGEALPHLVADTPVGILFGRERWGLENDEVALADAIVTFPVDPTCPSLNIAQAVLLVGYDWYKARLPGALPFRESERIPAPREMTVSFLENLEAELDAVGFFVPEKRALMVRNLRDMLLRRELTEQEVRTLRGAVSALVKGRRRGPAA